MNKKPNKTSYRKKTINRKRSVSNTPAKRKRKKMSGFSPAVVSGKRRKKRKVKGITGSVIGDALLGLGIGTAAAMALTKFIPMENKKARDGIIAALGVATIMVGAKQKDRMIQGIGSGLIVVGGTQLAQDFGVMPALTGFFNGIGITDDEDYMIIEMQGTDARSIMGLNEQQMMSGPNQLIPVVSGHMSNSNMYYDDTESQLNGDMPSVVSQINRNY